MDASSTTLYVAGGINSVNGSVRGKTAAFNLSDGQLSQTWTPTVDTRVQALTVSPAGDRVYLGGAFTTLNGEPWRHLAAVSPTSGARVVAFQPDVRVVTTDVVATPDTVVVGFAGRGGRVNTMDLAGRTQTSDQVDGNVQAVELLPGREVVGGGHFTRMCRDGTFCEAPVERRKLFSTGPDEQLTSFAPQLNSVFGVWCMAYDPASDRLVAGGDFTRYHGGVVNHLAFFDSP